MRLLVLAAFVLGSLPTFGQASQQPEDVFMAKFSEAVKADNYAVMKDLVGKGGAALVFNGYMSSEYQLCSAISNKNYEDKTARMAVLDKLANFANQELKDRQFLDRLAWLKTLSPEQAAKRMQVQDLLLE